MFLIGGPAFSGTTLLALLLNQGELVCLDEPDFHNPSQRHRGIPFLRELFPDRTFAEPPERKLTWAQATRLIEECERAIRPCELGMKTCDRPFVGYAAEYRRLGYPVVCIVRDIRDALVRPLPPWLSEERLNRNYRLVWEHADAFDLVVRYEDLVADATGTMSRVRRRWGARWRPRASGLPTECIPIWSRPIGTSSCGPGRSRALASASGGRHRGRSPRRLMRPPP